MCISCAASGSWAKKNAIGKEDVAKLVEDTYRCVIAIFAVTLMSLISDWQTFVGLDFSSTALIKFCFRVSIDFVRTLYLMLVSYRLTEKRSSQLQIG